MTYLLDTLHNVNNTYLDVHTLHGIYLDDISLTTMECLKLLKSERMVDVSEILDLFEALIKVKVCYIE